MIEHARQLLPEEFADRVRFDVADATGLPFEDAEFDLVVLLNMIPFFQELARVTAPSGHVLAVYSFGSETPIYVPPETLRERLEGLGFADFEQIAAGEGTAFLAARKDPGYDPGQATSAAR
jgi:SAM-dependent methyltransferase